MKAFERSLDRHAAPSASRPSDLIQGESRPTLESEARLPDLPQLAIESDGDRPPLRNPTSAAKYLKPTTLF